MEHVQYAAKNPRSGSAKKHNQISSSDSSSPLQRVENHTGLPDNLKAGIENLSGYSMDDVHVHYNSNKPAGLQAHAYAQGTDIHVAPGQERHLPHEAWHVVQQKQGRVNPTMQLKGKVNVNNNSSLENEADLMGTKALQKKATGTKLQQASVSSSVTQRVEHNDILDSRINQLSQRVLAILNVLMEEGQDWEKIYGKKGKELGNKGVKTVKKSLLGSGKKGPTVKEKIIKEALKRWWAGLSTEDKAEIMGESVSALSSFGSSMLGLLGGRKEEPKKTTKAEQFKADIDSEDLETIYEGYKQYKKVKDKIDEFEKGIVDLAQDVGSMVGVKVGGLKTEREFESKFKEQQIPYKVAQLEFAFLKESITDKNRYQLELDALSDALETRLQGPSAMINNPSLFSDKDLMASATEACSIAYGNLQAANILRNATTSGISNVKNWFMAKKEEFLGKSPESKQATKKKQGELVATIQSVCGKSWYWHTSGIFASKPNGIKEVEDKLKAKGTPEEKLIGIKNHFTKPEDDLAKTEKAMSSNDKEISKLSEALKTDLTVDKALSGTRSQKSTEKYGGKQVDNSSKLATLGSQKVRLELEKKNLQKKIKGENRKPLTQIFYNAVKDLQPDNEISLHKTLAIMGQIGAELDNSNHTKN